MAPKRGGATVGSSTQALPSTNQSLVLLDSCDDSPPAELQSKPQHGYGFDLLPPVSENLIQKMHRRQRAMEAKIWDMEQALKASGCKAIVRFRERELVVEQKLRRMRSTARRYIKPVNRGQESAQQAIVRWTVVVLYLFVTYYVNLLGSVIAGWRTPDLPGLPDVIHELTRPYIEASTIGAYYIRHTPDYFVIIAVVMLLLLLLVHEKRSIICRRLIAILGTVLLFRAWCVSVTSLPDMSPHCSEQFQKLWFGLRPNPKGAYKKMDIFPTAFIRANQIMLDPFLDTCGDLMFSGHTAGLWMCFMAYWEYCTYKPINAFMFVVASLGSFCIIGTLFHYTLDVSVAIFVTYTSWTLYHNWCNTGQHGAFLAWFEDAPKPNKKLVSPRSPLNSWTRRVKSPSPTTMPVDTQTPPSDLSLSDLSMPEAVSTLKATKFARKCNYIEAYGPSDDTADESMG